MRLAAGVGVGLLVLSQACVAQGTSQQAACENYRRQTGKVHPKCTSVPGMQALPLGGSTSRPAPVVRHQELLAEMPAPEQVLREITHADPLEAAARQSGALWQLQGIVEVIAEGRHATRQLTPAEERIIQSYKQANAAVHKQAHALLPEGKGGEQPSPSVKWLNRVGGYRSNKAYQTELLRKFFSPTWQRSFLAIQSGQEQAMADRDTIRRAAEASARETPVPSIVDSARVQKPSAGRPASEDMVRQVGEFVGGLGEGIRQAHAKECAEKGPPKATGAAIRGTYATPWTGTYNTWVAIDFDCGIALYCGAEERFREYSASANSVTVAGRTYARKEGALAGPKEVMITRTKPAQYRQETRNEYQGYQKGFQPADTTLVTPATTVKEQCAVGTLRKRES